MAPLPTLLARIEEFGAEAEAVEAPWRSIAQEYADGEGLFPERIHVNALFWVLLDRWAQTSGRMGTMGRDGGRVVAGRGKGPSIGVRSRRCSGHAGRPVGTRISGSPLDRRPGGLSDE